VIPVSVDANSPSSSKIILSLVETTAPAWRILDSATGTSCRLQDDTASARTYTPRPERSRDRAVCNTQTCDFEGESQEEVARKIGQTGPERSRTMRTSMPTRIAVSNLCSAMIDSTSGVIIEN
jgi:invasion protein IalB